MKPISEGGGGLTATPLSFGATNLGNLDTDPDTTTSNVGDIYYNTVTGVVKLLVDDGGGLIWYDIGRNITIGKTQVTGTAVTLSDVGTITSDMIGNTQVTVSKLATSSVTNTKVSTTANIDVTKIAGTAAALTTANTFTVGQQVIKTGADGNPGVSIWRNSVTQSAALLSLFQSDGSTVLAQVSAAGNVSLRNDNGAAAGVPLSITANASQSSNLLQILGSDNSTVRASISSAGALTLSPSSGTAATINGVANTVTAIVNGNATQSTDIIQVFATPSGVKRLSVNSVGRTQVNARMGIAPSGTDSTFPASLTVTDVTAGAANLQEWQTATPTTVASISSTGVITGLRYQTANAYGQVREANSGGDLYLKKKTATSTNPGSDIALLYFRDGTTAGTLKLVVRAGTAGAETTILDNIPQT